MNINIEKMAEDFTNQEFLEQARPVMLPRIKLAMQIAANAQMSVVVQSISGLLSNIKQDRLKGDLPK